jgi:hypothetical protein
MQLELISDMSRFSLGLGPLPERLAAAPRFEGWHVVIQAVGKSFVMRVGGEVYGHPDIEDGQHIRSPAVVWFDRKDRWVRCPKLLYRLGAPAGKPHLDWPKCI